MQTGVMNSEKMLGYHDTLDFPNKLESWSDLLHPQDKEKSNGAASGGN